MTAADVRSWISARNHFRHVTSAATVLATRPGQGTLATKSSFGPHALARRPARHPHWQHHQQVGVARTRPDFPFGAGSNLHYEYSMASDRPYSRLRGWLITCFRSH